MNLEIVQLEKYYGKIHALKNINFIFEEGIYGLLGSNGSGKSTLMNIITTNMRPTSGMIKWKGQDIQKLGKNYRRILGYVPQQQALYPDFSVEDFLNYTAALREIPKKTAVRKIDNLLDKMNLSEMKHFRLKMLSGGMKQRVLIAQALIGDPELLIMDEPTVGLDPTQKRQILNLIQQISKNRIVLLSTHIVKDLELIVDRILLLKEGSIVQSGRPEELICSINETKKDISSLEDVYVYYFGE